MANNIPMKLVFICSPYRGDVEVNVNRARRYCRFAYVNGCVPYAPHLHNPQFLDGKITEERDAGIYMGMEVLKRLDELWVFGDVLTEGMEMEFRLAKQLNIPIRYFTDTCDEYSYSKGKGETYWR